MKAESKKIVLLGQFGVGKTSLMRRFLINEFSSEYRTTLGVQIKKKEITLPTGRIITMIIWDLEGFSNVSKTRASYLIGSHGFIYVFDVTRPITYHLLHEEIDYLKEKYPEVILQIIGNKCDLKGTKEVVKYLAAKNVNVDRFVSAKTGEGVNELFLDIANQTM